MNSDRLFLPLNAPAFDWFLNRRKQWEIRRLAGRFNARQIRRGRRVELRSGYGKGRGQAWGTIEQVLTFESTAALFDTVPWSEVAPDAKSLEQACRLVEDILGLEREKETPLIAFRIVLDPEPEVRLATDYRPLVLSGSKTSTVRRGRQEISTGPAQLVFGEEGCINVIIVGIDYTIVKDLQDQHAVADGFRSRGQLLEALHQHYPGLGDEDPVTIIRFRRPT